MLVGGHDELLFYSPERQLRYRFRCRSPNHSWAVPLIVARRHCTLPRIKSRRVPRPRRAHVVSRTTRIATRQPGTVARPVEVYFHLQVIGSPATSAYRTTF